MTSNFGASLKTKLLLVRKGNKKQPQTIINDKKCSKTHKREAALDHMFCDINCKNVSSIDIKGSSLLFGQN